MKSELGNIKIKRERTIISTECFFEFSGLFLEFRRTIAIFDGDRKKTDDIEVEIII